MIDGRFGAVPLQYLARLRYGMGQPPPLSEEGVPILRATNISRGRITSANLQRAHVDDLPLDRAPLLEPGELLVVRSGAYTGDSAMVTEQWAGSAPGYDLRVTPLCGVEPRFISWSLLSRYCLDQIDLLRTRAAQPHLNADELASIQIPRPPLDVQRRIADYLDQETGRIDELVEAQGRALRLLDERATSLAYYSVMDADGLTTPLRYLARYVNGHPFKPEDRSDTGYPIIRIAQLLDPEADVDRYDGNPGEYCHVDSGDLIFSWSATLAAQIWDRGPAYVNQHLFKVLPLAGIDRTWLRYALEAAVHDLEPYMHGSTMTHITRPMLSRVSVPCPEPDRQQAVVDQIEGGLQRVERLRSATTAQIRLLTERRQALVTAAVTGELEV